MRLRVVAVLVWIALAACCLAVFGFTLEALVNALGCAVVVAVTVTDLERRIVPNRIVVPALAVALVVQTARDPSVEWIVAAIAAGGFFLLLALVYPAGLGMGDVKLAAFMGAWLGWDVAVALFAGSLLGRRCRPLSSWHGRGRRAGRPRFRTSPRSPQGRSSGCSSGTPCSTPGSAEPTRSLVDGREPLEHGAGAVVTGVRRARRADTSVRTVVELDVIAGRGRRARADEQSGSRRR